MNTESVHNPLAEQMATDQAQASGMDPMLHHLLETNLQQQELNQELAQSVWIPAKKPSIWSLSLATKIILRPS